MKVLCVFLIIFYIIFRIKSDHTAILDQMEDDIVDSSVLTTPCFITLLKKYMNTENEIKGTTAVISQMIRSAFQQRYLLRGIHQSAFISIIMKKVHVFHYSAEKMIEKSKVYVIFVSKSEDLLEHLPLLEQLPTYNTFAKIIVCFPNAMSSNDFEAQRKQSFKILFENDFFDIFVIGTRYNSTILESYTTYPYDNGNCAEKLGPIQLVDECQLILNNAESPSESIDDMLSQNQNDSIIVLVQHRSFFPKLPEQITGCQIPVTVSNFEPYVVINPVTKKIEKGVEVMIINTTFQELGAKVKFYKQDSKVRYYRTSLDNETGVFADIINK